MSRNEIRLRKHRTPGPATSRFRNYSDVLQRHERAMRIKEITRVLVIFIFILLVIFGMIYWFLQKKSQEPQKPKPTHSAMYSQDSPLRL